MPVSFIHGRTKTVIADSSRRLPRIEPALVEQAFSARAAGSSAGLDILSVRDLMERTLRSSGGRPSLESASGQAKIPRIPSDWDKIESLSAACSDLPMRPSPGQVAAMLIHIALASIAEKDIELTARREFSGNSSQ